jgi:muramidase (phage lysozyme)
MPGFGKGNFSHYTPAPTPKFSKAEHQVLHALITDPGQRRHILEILTPEDFSPEYQDLVNYLQQTDAAYDNIIDALNNEGTTNSKLPEQIAAVIMKDENLSVELIDQSCLIMYERRNELRKAALRQELHEAEQSGDEEKANILIRELHSLK